MLISSLKITKYIVKIIRRLMGRMRGRLGPSFSVMSGVSVGFFIAFQFILLRISDLRRYTNQIQTYRIRVQIFRVRLFKNGPW